MNEQTNMTIWTGVIYDGEQAYTERFIADIKDRKRVTKYLESSGCRILLVEPSVSGALSKGELQTYLQDACLFDRYCSMYLN